MAEDIQISELNELFVNKTINQVVVNDRLNSGDTGITRKITLTNLLPTFDPLDPSGNRRAVIYNQHLVSSAQSPGSETVNTNVIRDLAVTNAKLAANSVTTVKISDNSVTTNKLVDGSVTEPKIASNAVTTVKILDSAVTTNKINNLAVTTAKINDLAVTDAKLAANAVTTVKILDGAVTEPKLAANAVTTVKILDSAVTTNKINNQAVTSSKIANLNVLAQHIAAGAVTPTALSTGGPSWNPSGTLSTGAIVASGTLNATGAVTFNSTLQIYGTTQINSNLQVTGNVIAAYTSDERLKKDVVVISDALDKISKLNGVIYTWKDDTHLAGIREPGVIAQELEKVLPEAVVTKNDGYKAVKYDKVISLLIEGIKELKSEIEILKNGLRD